MPIYDIPGWGYEYRHHRYDCASESSCCMENNPVYMIGTKDDCFEMGNELNPSHVYEAV